MHRVIIRHRSVVTDALRWLGGGVPQRLVAWWRGPSARAEITASGVGAVSGATWWRPVALTVAPEAALQMRLVVPAEARRDLPHAVALAIRQDTPFEPEEVVAQAVEVERSGGNETYLIHLVPRRLIAEAVENVGRHRLGRVSAGAPEGPDLAAALFPGRRLRPWITVLPALIIIGVLAFGATHGLAEQEGRAAALEGEVAARLAELRGLAGQLEAIDVKAAAGNEIAAAIASSPVAAVLLERVRGALLPATEVTQVDLRGRDLTVSLRTSNALKDLARFIEAGWSATIEGAITAEPASGKEMATIRLPQPGSAG